MCKHVIHKSLSSYGHLRGSYGALIKLQFTDSLPRYVFVSAFIALGYNHFKNLPGQRVSF